MHDGKTVTFAQHFLRIGEPVTVQVRMVLPPPSLSPVLVHQMRRLAVLMPSNERDTEEQARVAALRDGLRELGWIEGRNVHTDYRWFGGDRDRAKAFAQELVEFSPSVLVADSTLALSAARHATATIPIVFLIVADPVGQGFVKSLSHPGGNITGFTGFEFAIGGKWLQLLKELVPNIARVGVIFNLEAGPYARYFMQSMVPVADSLGIDVIAGSTRNTDEIEPFIASLSQGMKAGLIVSPDAFTVANDPLIISLAANYRLPAVYAYRYLVNKGGLLSYGLSTIGPQLSTSCSQNGRSLQQLKAVIEFDGMVEVTTGICLWDFGDCCL
jgi:putative ABC transport system substrate-binding protein